MSAEPAVEPASSDATKDYGRGAAILTVGIGVTGIVTFLYLSLAAHALDKYQYGQVTLLWSAVFLITPIFYRPVEQLLARTIAERRVRDQEIAPALKIAGTIQLGLGLLFAVIAIIFRSQLEDALFEGNTTLYWIMFGSVIAYAVSFFGRGLLAGNQRFGLYGLLVFVESTVRFMFPLLAVIGVASGQTWIALGILAGPLASLFIVPLALVGRQRSVLDRRSPAEAAEETIEMEKALDAAATGSGPEEADFTLSEGGGFALAAMVIMIGEQTFLNAGPFIVQAKAGTIAAGAVVSLLIIARAPMQLFQSVSTSLLPHLSEHWTTGDFKTYRRSVRVTLLAILGFGAAVCLVLAIAGPKIMDILFDNKYDFTRIELVAIGAGMAIYLCAATLNQTALAARKAAQAVYCWVFAAGAFVVWMFLPVVSDPLTRVEIGYPAAAFVLFISLLVLYERVTPKPADERAT
ncbi:MAG: lipopolysaccharide biosynthesis protein [Solirubrobacterales bacterium]